MKNIVVGPRGSGRTEALLDLWLESILDTKVTSLFVTSNLVERDRIRRMLMTELAPEHHRIADLVVAFYELRENHRVAGLPRVRVFLDNAADILEREMGGLLLEACAVTVDEVTHHTGVGQKTNHVPVFDKCKHCEEVAKQFGEIKGEELVPEFLR